MRLSSFHRLSSIQLNSYNGLSEIWLNSLSSWLFTHGFTLTNREWASLCWIVIISAFVLSKQSIRSRLISALRAAVAPKLIVFWLVYVFWIISIVFIANWVGLWKPALTKDTLVWSTTTGVILLVGFTSASELGYFFNAIAKVLSVVVIAEYFFNFASFSFFVEFILQPIMFLLLSIQYIIEEPEQQKIWRQIRMGFFIVLFVAILSHTAFSIYLTWNSLDWWLIVLRIIWPMILGVWVILLVFALSIVANYERAFLRLRQQRNVPNGLWKSKLGLVLPLKFRLKWIHEAAKGGTTHQIANAGSVNAAYAAAQRFKADQISSMRREAVFQEDLERFAGSRELDEKGRPQDKREFRESIRALEWLHTCQMGWYQHDPTGYKPDLIEKIGDGFTRFGLDPSSFSIEVSDEGERWYAFRQTPGGHYFGIGASGKPPSIRTYDGTNPPLDFPNGESEWSDSPFSLNQYLKKNR